MTPKPTDCCRGFISQGSGKYEKSIEEAKRAIGLDPDFTPGYANLAFSNFYLDRMGEAEKILQLASERELENAEVFLLRYYIAFLRGDKTGMDEKSLWPRQAAGQRIGSPTRRLLSWPIPVGCDRQEVVGACGGLGSAGWRARTGG